MKVLVFSPLAVLGHHFETDLELIENHISKGDDVYNLTCNGILKKVGPSACKGIGRCYLCTSRRDQGLSLISNANNLKLLELDIPKTSHSWKFQTQKDLSNITYKGVDVGAAVLSTIISNLREPKPDVLKFKNEIGDILNQMAGLTDFFENLLNDLKPDLIYFFNGRYSFYRPVLRLAQLMQINFYVHERGGNNSKYLLTSNTYPHDLPYMKKYIEESWTAAEENSETKSSIGEQWFVERQRGINQSWFSFTEHQKAGMLPQNFDKNRTNISIFISSEDEFEAIEGWENPLFSDQAEGVEYILDNSPKDIFFYIRVHPNLKGLRNSQTKRIKSWKFPNAEVIPAGSEINSYALLMSSDKVITFGSTIGAESVYAQVPSILVGRAFYEDLNGCYKPNSKKELIELIHKRLKPLDKSDILKFGFWASSYGRSFIHYKPLNLSTGTFKNTFIKGNLFVYSFGYLFTFFYNVFLVLMGRMDLGYLYNRILNKIAK